MLQPGRASYPMAAPAGLVGMRVEVAQTGLSVRRVAPASGPAVEDLVPPAPTRGAEADLAQLALLPPVSLQGQRTARRVCCRSSAGRVVAVAASMLSDPPPPAAAAAAARY